MRGSEVEIHDYIINALKYQYTYGHHFARIVYSNLRQTPIPYPVDIRPYKFNMIIYEIMRDPIFERQIITQQQGQIIYDIYIYYTRTTTTAGRSWCKKYQNT